MDLELNRLSAVETPIHGEVRLADPDASLARDGIRLPAPFRVEGAARLQRGLVVVTGRVTGELELECGRCLGRVRQPIDVTFEARFAEAAAAPKPVPAKPSRHERLDDLGDQDGVDGLLLQRDDLDVSFLPAGTTVLKLEDVIREQVLLEVPLRPLCRPDCKGLCARCGADLNRGDCGCPPEETHDLRLAGLADIKKKLEGGSGPEPPKRRSGGNDRKN